MLRHDLTEEFDNDEPEHFTHYDYLLQLIENGQFSAFSEHLKTLKNSALVRFFEIMPDKKSFKLLVSEEIILRIGE